MEENNQDQELQETAAAPDRDGRYNPIPDMIEEYTEWKTEQEESTKGEPQQITKSNDTPFSNDQISISTLPQLAEVQFVKLHENHKYVGLLSVLVYYMLVLMGSLLVALFWEKLGGYTLYLILAITLYFIFQAYAAIKSYHYEGYALREHDLLYREGWIWKSTIAVPYKRMQHIEVHQGPIDRLFDMASISLYTAGGSDADMSIEGLTPSEANSLKEHIMRCMNKEKTLNSTLSP
jgi:uncharacterized protein